MIAEYGADFILFLVIFQIIGIGKMKLKKSPLFNWLTQWSSVCIIFEMNGMLEN